MLNALLNRHGTDRIEMVHFLNPGLDKSHIEKRGVFLDARIQDETRRQYTFSLRNDATCARLTNHLTLHYFELPRLGKVPPTHVYTPAEAWLNLLKFGHLYVPGTVPLPVEIMTEEGVAMAIDKLKKARESREARQWAEMYDKAERTRITNLNVARKEGIEKGIEKGERIKALDIARRLIARGDSNDAIADVTGLAQAEIEALRKD